MAGSIESTLGHRRRDIARAAGLFGQIEAGRKVFRSARRHPSQHIGRGGRAESRTGGFHAQATVGQEDRGHRRQRAHRHEAGEQAASSGPRGRGGVALLGRQHRHGRGAGRSAGGRRQVVVDVANSPSFEDTAVLEFFETSGRNLLAAEAAAGVGHHVALSVVGTDRLPESGYMRAKMAQEKLIKAVQDALHDRARDAVLRVRRRHRRSRPPRGRRSACRRPCCSRSCRTTSPPRWPTSRSGRR